MSRLRPGPGRARLLGYLVALVVGLGVAAPLAYHACLDSMFRSGPMSPAEQTRVNLLWSGALAAPVVSVGGYALLELVIRRLRARRARRGARTTPADNVSSDH